MAGAARRGERRSAVGRRARDRRAAPELDAEPVAGARFAELPTAAARAESYDALAQDAGGAALPNARARAVSLRESRRARRSRARPRARSACGCATRCASRATRRSRSCARSFAPQLARCATRSRAPSSASRREREQYSAKKIDTVISIGASVVGALFGRKLASRTNVGRAATAMRGIGRAADERGDVGRAEERAEQTAREARRAGAELSAGDRGARSRAAPTPSRSRSCASRRARPISTSSRWCWSGRRGASRRTAARSRRGRPSA